MYVYSPCFVAGTQWIILGTATPRAREREVSMSQLCVEKPTLEAWNPAGLFPPNTSSNKIRCNLLLVISSSSFQYYWFPCSSFPLSASACIPWSQWCLLWAQQLLVGTCCPAGHTPPGLLPLSTEPRSPAAWIQLAHPDLQRSCKDETQKSIQVSSQLQIKLKF